MLMLQMLSFSSFLIPHLILLLTLPTAGRGYPDGAPDMVCVSMEPTGHGAGSQVTDPPYRLMVTRKSYKPGETLQVTLQSIGDNYFRGLMLQARLTGCDVNETQTIGVFTTGDNELQTRHCFGTVHSTVTHNSASRKRMKIVYWTAPVVSSGHVIMTATVVREQQEFWTQVQSHVLSDLEADFPAYCPPTLRPDPPTSHSSSESSLSLPTEPFLTSLPSLTQTTLLVVNQTSDEVMSSPAVVMDTEVTQTMDLNDHNLGHKDGGTPEREKSEDTQSFQDGWEPRSIQRRILLPRWTRSKKCRPG
ncbi:putative defense protein 3 isoform X1 [Pomacea canaliculata]|uniref:putative defense protein 3 isoform X1 n=1 Tax=Pomacea canaliculata TaxID=400727 RepID=UPI000D73559A|nr:putative defense protein 3 isoform X1 [Pomacea canaliculata]